MGMGRDGGLYVYALRLLAYLYKRLRHMSLFRSRFEMIGARSFLTHFQSVRRRSRPITSQPRLFILASICPRGVFLLLASGVLEDMVCLSRRPEVPR